MTAFLSSFFIVLLAEMGDKTQLVALAFATRFPAAVVLGGISVATLLVHLISVGIGEALGVALPETWIQVLAGVAFLIFGLWTLRGDRVKNEAARTSGRAGLAVVLATVAMAFFLAELGDKTMLATITMASRFRSFTAVWLGSTLGMVVADGVAIAAGVVLGRRLPERAIRTGAALAFLSFGVWMLLNLPKAKAVGF